jgi:hypothetical protein
MVAELETLLEPSSHSPEAQWRSRILMRSAQDADRDIWKRLYEYETSFGENPQNSRAQLASRKMHRDFRRVHNGWTSICEQYKQRQHVEVSFLSAEPAPSSSSAAVHGSSIPSTKQNPRLAAMMVEGEEKEDFFDRAMRERDAELRHIHASVHKVNEIYSVRFVYQSVCVCVCVCGHTPL